MVQFHKLASKNSTPYMAATLLRQQAKKTTGCCKASMLVKPTQLPKLVHQHHATLCLLSCGWVNGAQAASRLAMWQGTWKPQGTSKVQSPTTGTRVIHPSQCHCTANKAKRANTCNRNVHFNNALGVQQSWTTLCSIMGALKSHCIGRCPPCTLRMRMVGAVDTKRGRESLYAPLHRDSQQQM
jgi:hypothetical protein